MATRDEIRPLTGIRGVAALLVAVYHLNGPEAPAALRIGGLGGVIVAHGYLAVDLFFVLSGYVIALSYGEMLRSWDARSYARFLIRRIARVYPLYAAITLAMGALLALGVSHEPVGRLGPALGFNLLMVQAWGFAASIDGPAWSISTEWAAYLLFPLLAAVTLFGRPRAALATGVAATACVIAMAWLPSAEPARNGPLDIYGPGISVARCIAEFSLGLIAFRLAGDATVRRFARHPASGVLIAGGIAALLMRPGTDLFLVALFPPMVLALALGTGPVQRFFGCAPVFLAGELSYAIYLLHARFLRPRDVLDAKLIPLFGEAAPVITMIAIYAALLIGAWLAFRWLEKPSRAYVRRAERLIRPTAPLAPAEAEASLTGALSPQ